ncbi:MAG: MFS transporter [Victivallales bacterium]|nr:MFS transporter [Victivallales bacterium]
MENVKTKKHKPVYMAYVVWLIATAFFFWDYLQEVSPGAMGNAWKSAFGVNDAFLGLISAFFYYSYGLMQIPAGLIDDYFGPRRPVIAALLLAVLGNILLAVSAGPYTAALSRLMIGIGVAFAYISAIKLISNWFPYHYIGIMMGWTAVFGMIGGVSGAAPLNFFVDSFGWRLTIWVLASFGIILALLFIFIVRSHPPKERLKRKIEKRRKKVPDEPKHEKHEIIDHLKHVFFNKQIWYTGIFVAGMNAVLFTFAALWGPSFVITAHPGISYVEATGAMSMVFVGGIPGAVFYGWISEKLERRKMPLIISAALTLALMSFLIYGPPLSLTMIYISIGVLGFLCASYVVAFALANDNRPPGSTGIAIGFVNTCSVVVCAVFQPVIGLELDILQESTGKLNYFDYEFALTVMTGLLVFVLISSLLVKETNCKPVFENLEDL